MGGADAIYAREVTYLGTYLQLGLRADRVRTVKFPSSPTADVTPDHPLLDRLGDYFDGERQTFADVDITLPETDPARAVLARTREIPYGTNATVGTIARRIDSLSIDREADEIAIQEALAANPAPVLVPDHRIRDGASGAPPQVEQRLRSLERL